MKYAFASITKSCTNYGNFLIEYNLLKLLEKHGFGKPNFVFDSMVAQDETTIEKINGNDFIIIPGCTTLRIGHYPGLESVLPKINIPIYDIGATFFGKPTPDFLEFEKYFQKPITVRDPEAEKYLKENNIENIFIGCPTLFTGNAKDIKPNSSKKIVFVFGLKEIEKQIQLYNKLIQTNYDVTVIPQEENQNDFLKNLNTKIVKYTPGNIIKECSEAHLVVTGRLHGALPALALGVPVFFLETFDNNRFSLLEFLKVHKYNFDDPNITVELLKKADQKDFQSEYKETYEKIELLRKRFSDYLDLLYKEVNAE